MRPALAFLGGLLCFASACGCGGDDQKGNGDTQDAGGSGGTAEGGSGGSGASTGGAVASGGATTDSGGATASDGGAAGAAGAGGTTTTTVSIDAEASLFLDYGKLRLVFTQAVDANTLTLEFSPAKPSALAATGFTQVNPTTVDVALAYYHLPLDYQITVNGKRPDATPFTTDATLPGLHNGARLAFITKQLGSGDARTWADAPANASTGLAAADAVCQSEAETAGFKGKFVAYLSVSGSVDAGCRAFGLSGLLSAKCGQATMPSDHAPWLSTTGLPIVNGASDIVGDLWETPIPYHANGTRSSSTGAYGSSVRHGTNLGGVASGYDCGGWTVASGGSADSTTFAGEYLLEPSSSFGCSDQAKLLCLQVDETFFEPNTLHQVSGKRVFVSKGKLGGAMSYGAFTGVAAADALCQSEAGAAQYENAPSFRAFLKTTTDDALCHVLGGAGKTKDSCGLSAWPPTDQWRRADGYPVATVQELSGVDSLIAPVLYDSSGKRLTSSQRIWSGALDGSLVDHTCGDWGSTSGTGNVAIATSTAAWDLYSSASCGTSLPVLCFEGGA